MAGLGLLVSVFGARRGFWDHCLSAARLRKRGIQTVYLRIPGPELYRL